jgi:hypothetical protein
MRFLPTTNQPNKLELVLERIAVALERLVTLQSLSALGRNTSSLVSLYSGTPEEAQDSRVAYTEDQTEFLKELRREAYTNRTGILLGEDEDPPSPTDKNGIEWGGESVEKA